MLFAKHVLKFGHSLHHWCEENERIADGRLAGCREIQPGMSYCFAITKSIFYSLVPRLKVPWLVWCVIKRVAVQISPAGLLSGLWSAAGTALVRLHHLGKDLSTAVPNCKSSVALWKTFTISTETPAGGKKSGFFFSSVWSLEDRQTCQQLRWLYCLLG